MKAYLHSLATLTPPASFTQEECWATIDTARERLALKNRTFGLIQKVLLGNNGIKKRHFAVSDIEHIFELGADSLNRSFRDEAVRLGTETLTEALERAGLRSTDLDALFVCTCTGYLCPGLSSYIAENVGLRPDTMLQDIVGLGCGAALPTLRAASHALLEKPHGKVACLAVEICSAAFYLDDDPGVVISACLFGDGAAASIWGGTAGPTGYAVSGFDSLHLPQHREHLRFESRKGKLRNLLTREVPDLAARAVRNLYERANGDAADHVLAHPGGRDVICALEAVLPGRSLDESRGVLHDYGNMSSPSVLFALDHHLKHSAPRDRLWLVTFGAGFSAHSCHLTR